MRIGWTGCVVVAVGVLAGCQGRRDADYRSEREGFRLTPPAGWSERARDREAAPGGAGRERLLVQYKRLTAGRPAWLRVTVAEAPAATPPTALVAGRTPAKDWRREGTVESLEVRGLPAARIAFTGRWGNQDYVSETVAVRRDGRVYFLTGTFPAADDDAHEQVRRAVDSATWEAAGDTLAQR
jgi:hypothetical protein